MSTYGRQVLNTTGIPVMVLANLDDPIWKAGGITIDWSLVSAVAADTTLNDGTIIPNGQKGLEYGTILCAKDTTEVQTLTISATGGTFTITANGNTTSAIAYNASAAAVQSAVRGLGGSYASVGVSGSAGGPYTFTYPTGSGDIAQPTTTSSLTGGSGTATFATTTAGANTGTYGPYDSTATDGRQNLSRGYCFILNETVLQSGALSFYQIPSDHPAVFDGGLVWKARLKVGGNNPSYINSGSGLQPTWSAFETAFPRISYAIG